MLVVRRAILASVRAGVAASARCPAQLWALTVVTNANVARVTTDRMRRFIEGPRLTMGERGTGRISEYRLPAPECPLLARRTVGGTIPLGAPPSAAEFQLEPAVLRACVGR